MSGPAVNKKAIAQNFSGAARRYDAWATAQAGIAAALARRIPAAFHPLKIVDLGCGTGLLIALLRERYAAAELVGIDIAKGMVDQCRQRWPEKTASRVRFVTGDVENANLLVPAADLITCSCSAQWFVNLPGTLAMWSGALAPGGKLALACLLEGSFCELEAAHREALQSRFPGLRLPPAEVIPGLLKDNGLPLMVCEEERVSATYPSSRDALRSFQQMGSVFQGQPSYKPLGAAQARRLLASYDRRADSQGRVSVTHRVQYLIAERKQ